MNSPAQTVGTSTLSKQSIRWTIIRNSTSLFSVNLPGVHVLIPDYLRSVSPQLFAT